MGKDIFLIGILVFLFSAWPIGLMGIEVVCNKYARNRYEIQPIDSPDIAFGNHLIRIDHSCSPTKINIDNIDYSSGTSGDKCFVSFLKDNSNNQRYVTITQSEPRKKFSDLHYRILRIPLTAAVQEEIFHFNDRFPFYRALLISRIHPQYIGVYSDLMCIWPSLFYPILYPCLSAIAGLILMFLGGIRIWKR